jgi:hypothetical protein
MGSWASKLARDHSVVFPSFILHPSSFPSAPITTVQPQ